MPKPFLNRFCAILLGLLLAVAAPWTAAAPATQPAETPFVLHLPGIGGFLRVDRSLIAGLKQGGVTGEIVPYDWTEHDPGIHALQAYARNKKEAQKVADIIARRFREHPTTPIELTSHSGGAAIAVWALERLPAGIEVENVFLLSPALSPKYDLTKALRHVRGKMFVFSSVRDTLILGAGCQMFGTMDGVQCEAAGLVGFKMPGNADADQYKKLVSEPYQDAWADKYDNWGDHIGVMQRPFVAAVVAPLLLGDAASASAAIEATAHAASRLAATPTTHPAETR